MQSFINTHEHKTPDEIRKFTADLLGEEENTKIIKNIVNFHRCGIIQLDHSYYSPTFLKELKKFVKADELGILSNVSGIEIIWFFKE